MGRINTSWLQRHKQKPAATPALDKQPAPIPPPAPAETAPQNVIFDEKPADALLKSVNDTAGNARNLFVTYILLYR